MLNLPVRAALVAVAAGSVLAPVSATAETLKIDDGTSDAWEQVFASQTSGPSYVEAGSPVNADLTRTVVRHSARRVTVRSNFVKLTKNAEGVMMAAKIRTDEGLWRAALVFHDGSRKGAFMLKKRGEVSCTGLTKEVDFAHDAVQISVPRACLSAPRWVQVTVAGGNYGEGASGHSYIDVAGIAGHRFSHWSARIHRG
ncbi:hypothetical protein [Nocardioides mesophilus]|uniref:Uncharacterized protein n=1 Tax=Nocardioides mesophilus TaxID=433659 RepID=A0A7G9RA30_9ACTN|nr:hypothetical protein [Nocardioides mesophilus]QNN52455.1 hypothetical protein H9L09_18575 [Nocardioides mesophilus]